MISNMAAGKDFNIAIIGGGIAGLTLAIALHHRGIRCTIYEQAHKFGEIGAGVSFSPNAVQAMRLCHQEVYEAFERVCTRNLWPSKKLVWFDYFDAWAGDDGTEKTPEKPVFQITNDLGQNGVHRARFLDEMVHLVPNEIACFGKRLKSLDHDDAGKCVMNFEDGSTAEADAVIGCDGIKSMVRRLMHGPDHPCAQPTYTYKYAYRGIVPMEQAVEAIGAEKAQNSCMHMGPNNHVLTFPVNKGETLNIVAFHTTDQDWQNSEKLTAPAKREDALRDFAGYSEEVIKLLKLTHENLDTWAIFDLGTNPPPSYAKGRVALLGDAAHATSPHHGAGAGMCIEDAAVMAELIADPEVKTGKDVEAVFGVFDELRRTRGEFLVQSSRLIGDVYEWRAEQTGRDFAKCQAEIQKRNDQIANVDIEEMVREGREKVHQRMNA